MSGSEHVWPGPKFEEQHATPRSTGACGHIEGQSWGNDKASDLLPPGESVLGTCSAGLESGILPVEALTADIDSWDLFPSSHPNGSGLVDGLKDGASGVSAPPSGVPKVDFPAAHSRFSAPGQVSSALLPSKPPASGVLPLPHFPTNSNSQLGHADLNARHGTLPLSADAGFSARGNWASQHLGGAQQPPYPGMIEQFPPIPASMSQHLPAAHVIQQQSILPPQGSRTQPQMPQHQQRTRHAPKYVHNQDNRIYVSGLRDGTDAEQLRAYFVQFGPVSDVYLPKSYSTGRLQPFGFVT